MKLSFIPLKKHNAKAVSIVGFFLIGILLALPVIVFLLHRSSVFQEKNRYREALVIDVFDSRANFQGLQSGWFGKLIQDQFNMQLNIIAPNIVGGGDTLYETRVAAGNLGDLIICNGEGNNLQKLVEAGLVLDMRPYLDGRESLFTYESAIRALNDPIDQQAIYAIPTELSTRNSTLPSESNDTTYGPFLRYDLYARLGYPEIKTLEELLPVLKSMQELAQSSQEPIYGFSFFPDWDDNMMTAAKQPACFYGYEEHGFVLYRADGGDYQDIMDDSSLYLRILRLYFEAGRLGLVDPDSPSQTYQEVFQKYEDGQVLYSPWPWLAKSAYNTAEHEAAGQGFMLVPIDDMKILSFGCKPGGNSSTILAVGANAKDPQRLVDFICWLYSPEGIYANGAQRDSGAPGPEGLTWENTENGPCLTSFGVSALLGSKTQMPEGWGTGTWEEGVSTLNVTTVSLMDTAPNGYPYYYNLWDSYQELTDNALTAHWKEQMHADTTIEYLQNNDQLMVLPGSGILTPGEPQEISSIRTQCKKIITQYSWNMVFAENEEEFLELKKRMQTIVKSLGYDQVVALDLQNAKAQMKARLDAAAMGK